VTEPLPPTGQADHPVDGEPDSHGALRLSRRKAASGARLVRTSVVAARRVAAPYETMTRVALAQIARSRLARLGGIILAALAIVALSADLLASDLPIACRWHSTVYLLPSVTHPEALAGVDCSRMRRDRAPGDWQIDPLALHGPMHADPGAVLSPPLTPGHGLGTDAAGRDLFARLVHGTSTALGLGLAGSVVLVAIGVSFGAAAGFLGGLTDAIVSRAVESLVAIPTFLLVLVVGALVPHATTTTLLWTIALTRWTELSRVVRAEVLVTLGTDYVTAARALGVSSWRILVRHVLPNAIGPALVAAAFGIASIVLIEAAVDFLRVGSPDGSASWGEALGEARGHPQAWWLIAFPGTLLLLTLVALNLVGEAARDALDPKLRGSGEDMRQGMRG
jgi:peptide/nickel transport system permease protein